MNVATPTDAAGAPAAAERTLRRVAWVLLGVAVTLFVASSLHLSGAVHGSPPYDADHAGIAEALIGVVLVVSALVMLRAPGRARGAGMAGTAFAVVGFGVGLSFTSQGGHAPDIAYHVIGLPVLLVALIVLLRTRAVHSLSADAQPRTA